MRRLPMAPTILCSFLLAAPALGDDVGDEDTVTITSEEPEEEEDYEEEEDEEPSVFQGYLIRAGTNATAGLNGVVTFPVDPLAFASEGEEVFDSAPAAGFTGRLIGLGAGALQGAYRALTGASDVVLALCPAMPMLSPVPRYKLLPYEHPDE